DRGCRSGGREGPRATGSGQISTPATARSSSAQPVTAIEPVTFIWPSVGASNNPNGAVATLPPSTACGDAALDKEEVFLAADVRQPNARVKSSRDPSTKRSTSGCRI